MSKVAREPAVNFKLKGRIVEQGLTMREVAEKAHIPVSTLSDKINGKTEFKASEIHVLCKILKIDDIKAYFFTY